MKTRMILILLAACLGWVVPQRALADSNHREDGLSFKNFYPAQDLIDDLTAWITSRKDAAGVPGLSVALIQHGDIVWVKGFGVTNSITRAAVSGDTVFDVASISKVIAAYAALRLVEQGVLDLDKPVHLYLSQPWLPPSTYADQITLRHLLTHTSGLTNQVNPPNKTIIFPPGERYEYSGVGFLYLQVVMEQVTGKPLEQLAQELVFEPLEMRSSSYEIPKDMLPRLANGHIRYSYLFPTLLPVLALAFGLSLLVGMIAQWILSKKFKATGKMLGISYAVAASLTLSLVIYMIGTGVNKWVALIALWLVVIGAGMALLLYAGSQLIARLTGKRHAPRLRATLMVIWFLASALALLALISAPSGPIPRLPAGTPNAFASLRATAPDLAKFLLELSAPQHLAPALMAEMTSPEVDSAENQSWGLGIGIQHTPNGKALFHSGNNPDFHAWMVIDPAQRNGVVILTNGENGASLAEEIAGYVMDHLAAAK